MKYQIDCWVSSKFNTLLSPLLHESFYLRHAGRQSSSTLSKPIFHMGASFDDKSDDESTYESNGIVINNNNNNNNKNVKDENIPLVSRK